MVIQSGDEIRILAPDCSVSDRWVMGDHAAVFATSPEEDLVAIELLKPIGAVELWAARSHEVKQRWMWSPAGGFVFAQQGRLVCAANYRTGKLCPDAACWDTRTGAKVAENDKIGVGRLGIASAGGDLLAMTDSKFISHQGKLWKFLDMNDDYEIPRRQLLWNVRTGKEVASWGNVGKLQQTELWDRDPKRVSTVKTAFVLSLSPTGKYLAEGGSGSVSVYAIQP